MVDLKHSKIRVIENIFNSNGYVLDFQTVLFENILKMNYQ